MGSHYNSGTELESLQLPADVESHPAWLRLKDQLKWYDSKSICCRKRYKTIKIFQIIFALAIPVFNLWDLSWNKLGTSLLGAFIAFFEGLEHLNQYSSLWVSYRSTAEQLKHEKYLFLSSAGPYRNLQKINERLLILAERTEEHVSTEHAKWIREIQNTNKKEN